ncbi:MAG: PqqD family protein [Armatimonadota bacterium]|nr:PqqD family protein [Armatimonadota bacterium]
MTDNLTGIKPAPHVLFQELEGEMVLLNLETERYYGLDEVGTRFWQLLTEYGNVETIVARMLGEFEVAEATLRSDLTNLMAQLSTAGLLVSQE